MSNPLPPGLAESVLLALQGVPVWQALVTDDGDNSRRRQAQAAFRATSWALRGLADGLVSVLTDLRVGSQHSHGTAGVNSACRQCDEQRQVATSLLGRLPGLRSVGFSVGPHGDVLLLQLLREQLLARVKLLLVDVGNLTEWRVVPNLDVGALLEAISSGMPLLEELKLLLLSHTCNGLAPLSRCSKLHTLAIFADQLLPNCFADLAGFSSLKSLQLDNGSSSVAVLPDQVLSQLTQLTHLTIKGVCAQLAAVSNIPTLQQLEVPTPSHLLGRGELGQLTALTKLLLGRVYDRRSLSDERRRELWLDLSAITQLRELRLSEEFIYVALPDFPSWQHRQLTRLEVQVPSSYEDLFPLPQAGQPLLPVLEQLQVDGVYLSDIGLEVLCHLLAAAPNLQRIAINNYLAVDKAARAYGWQAALQMLEQAARLLAAVPAVVTRQGSIFLGVAASDIVPGPMDADELVVDAEVATQLMTCLQPLSAIAGLTLGLKTTTMELTPMLALFSALPNLVGLELLQLVPLDVLEHMTQLPNLQSLKIGSVQENCPACIHALEALQLTTLLLMPEHDGEVNFGLTPWSHQRPACTMPDLRDLTLPFGLRLHDLHYLLHSAPNTMVHTATSEMMIQLCDDKGAYTPQDLAQQLMEVAVRLAAAAAYDQISCIVLCFEGEAATMGLSSIIRALQPCARVLSGKKLKLYFEGVFGKEAAGALATSLPELGRLTLFGCSFDGYDALPQLARHPGLSKLTLVRTSAPELFGQLMAVQGAAPHLEVEAMYGNGLSAEQVAALKEVGQEYSRRGH